MPNADRPASLLGAQVVARAFACLLLHMRQLTVQLSPHGGASQLPGVVAGPVRGWRTDLSDPQWRTFRALLPLLLPVALGTSLLTRLVRARAPAALLWFHLAFGLAYAGVSFGGKCVLLLLLASASFALSKAVAGFRVGPAAVWSVNCLALLWVQAYGRLPLAQLLPFVGGALDRWRGLTRWDTTFNMAVLRMISFGMDVHWAAGGGGGGAARLTASPGTTHAASHDALRALAELPLAVTQYSYPLFLAYVLFPPLALAGPVLSCNAYAAQLVPPSSGAAAAAAAVTTPRALVRAAARWVGCLLCLEALCAGLHANALSTSGAWRRLALPPASLAAVGYFTLAFMWLKFSAIWRFFGLWSAACGVTAPENMTRCFSNNYDVAGFWRSWHASYNRWLVRYAYVPLGGSDPGLSVLRRAANAGAVFLFVALWHDLAQPRLLGWAVLCCACLAPEAAARAAAARSPACAAARDSNAYRTACAAAAALSIAGLMAANTVGFVLGASGGAEFGRRLLRSREGVAFAAASLITFFCAAQLMFELRASEARRRDAKRVAA